MCGCGGKKGKGWRVTYPNGTSINTTDEAVVKIAESKGATVKKLA